MRKLYQGRLVRIILQNPEAEQQYYFKSVIKINTMRGKCYIGIVVNDTTREMIEFSVELMELETISEEEREQILWDIGDTLFAIVVAGGAFLLIWAMKVVDKKLDKKN